jgi:hypothetical protein
VPAAEQLNRADLASCGESSLSYYRRAGRAAHLKAVVRIDEFSNPVVA